MSEPSTKRLSLSLTEEPNLWVIRSGKSASLIHGNIFLIPRLLHLSSFKYVTEYVLSVMALAYQVSIRKLRCLSRCQLVTEMSLIFARCQGVRCAINSHSKT